MKRYREVCIAAALFLLTLVVIGGFFLWIAVGMSHDFLPEDGIFDCEKLNASIDLIHHVMILDGKEYPILIDYGGTVLLRDEQQNTEYGWIEKRLFKPEDKIYIHVGERDKRFIFIRREEIQ